MAGLLSFLQPSEKVAAERREAVFGTANKAVATAAIGAAGVAAIAAPALIASGAAAKAVTSVASKLWSSFAGAKLSTQAAVVVSAPIVASALATSPTLRSGVANLPSGLVNVGSNIGNLVENPTAANLSSLIKENPVIVGALGAGAVVAGGLGVGALANTASTILNTKAIKENTKVASQDILSTVKPLSPVSDTALVAPAVDSSVKTPIIPSGDKSSIANTRKRTKKAKESPRVTQSVRVYNIDDRDKYDRKVYK